MKCPNCEKEIAGKACPDCGSTMPEEAKYCMECGSLLVEYEDDANSAEFEDDLDFENRVLCPDGTCTGIIVDGKCTECGKPLAGNDAAAGTEENGDV